MIDDDTFKFRQELRSSNIDIFGSEKEIERAHAIVDWHVDFELRSYGIKAIYKFIDKIYLTFDTTWSGDEEADSHTIEIVDGEDGWRINTDDWTFEDDTLYVGRITVFLKEKEVIIE